MAKTDRVMPLQLEMAAIQKRAEEEKAAAGNLPPRTAYIRIKGRAVPVIVDFKTRTVVPTPRAR